jgi:hypothetical protein
VMLTLSEELSFMWRGKQYRNRRIAKW